MEGTEENATAQPSETDGQANVIQYQRLTPAVREKFTHELASLKVLGSYLLAGFSGMLVVGAAMKIAEWLGESWLAVALKWVLGIVAVGGALAVGVAVFRRSKSEIYADLAAKDDQMIQVLRADRARGMTTYFIVSAVLLGAFVVAGSIILAALILQIPKELIQKFIDSAPLPK